METLAWQPHSLFTGYVITHIHYDISFSCVVLQQSSFMADSSIMEQLQSHHEGIVDVYGVSMATSMRFCAISRLINWTIDCCIIICTVTGPLIVVLSYV